MKYEGRTMKHEGRRMKHEGRTMKHEGRRMKAGGMGAVRRTRPLCRMDYGGWFVILFLCLSCDSRLKK